MANRTETIKVRVTPERKEKFEKYIEDTGEFPSVSQLLRASANAHIHQDDEQTTDIDPEQITSAIEIGLSDVHERLARIEQEVNRVDTAVQPNNEDVDDLADDIAMQLPVMDSSKELRDTNAIMEERAHSGMSDLEFTKEMSTIEFWADFVDADKNKTRRAINRATNWYPDVQWTYDENMGKRRYYRTSEAE
ncbi:MULTISPECIES: hypothetical protein [Haloarcula]|uniref:hypothetical protein n=1 Tax=Haloarcula TaxID=2237 RepID=UPI0023ED5620|nr:hypothetical protein [Halomicroarcula sp. XH51]